MFGRCFYESDKVVTNITEAMVKVKFTLKMSIQTMCILETQKGKICAEFFTQK